MKYYIWYREKNPMIIMGVHYWKLHDHPFESKEEVLEMLNKTNSWTGAENEFRIIKGEELEWEEEYETVTYTETKLKSKKLKI